MMTSVSDLQAALLRMIQGGWVVADSLIYLLSRDGEQLRPIGEIVIRGGKKKTVVIERAAEEGETLTVGELLIFCRGVSPDVPVKMIADGFGEANAADLEWIQLNSEILSLKKDQVWIDYAETSVVLCT